MGCFLLFCHSVFGWLTTVVLLVVCSFCAWLTAPFASDRQRHYHWWAKLWAQGVLLACRVRVEVEGREVLDEWMARGPVVVASNHQSTLDIPILLATLPGYFAFVSKVELFSVPLMGAYMKACGIVPIRRGDRASASAALESAVGTVHEGRSVLMFSEGTRSPNGTLGQFKRGTVLLAARAGVGVLPVAIVGSFSLMPKQTLLQRPGPVSVRVGPIIGLSMVDPERLATVTHATTRLRNAVENLYVRPAGAVGAPFVATTRRV